MVQRNQQPANLDASRIGGVSLQQAQTPFGSNPKPTQIQDNPISDRLVKLAQHIEDRVVDDYTETQYLRGQNAAATGQSLADLDSSWLAKPFTSAGFADEDKRLQMSNVAANITGNMKTLRQMTPTDFLGYLNQQTQGVFNNTDNMSMQGKKALLENQLTFNRTLIRTQAVENAKYNIDQRAQIYTSQGNTLAAMTAQAKASGDAQAYGEASAAFQTWTRSILTDEKLPQDVRYAHVKSLAQNFIAQDLRAPVQQLLNSNMLKDMPSEDLAGLQGALRESQNRTMLADHQQWFSDDVNLQVQQATTGDVSPAQMQQHIEQGIQNGAISSPEAYTSRLIKFNTELEKNLKSSNIATAISSGDTTTLLKYNVGADEAVNIMAQHMVKAGAQAPQVAMGLLQVGAAHGNPAAFKKAGEILNPALANFGTPGAVINPQDAAELSMVADNLNVYTQTGDKAGLMKFMETMSPENQSKWAYIAEQTSHGMKISDASAAYQAQQASVAGMTPQEKAIDNTERAKVRTKALASIQQQGLTSRTWTGVMGIFSEEARNEWSRRVASGDNQTSLEVNAVRSAFGQEVLSIQRLQPYLTANELESQAGARLAGRITRVGGTWHTPGSLLIAPQNQTINSALGLPANVASDRAGMAIDALGKANAPEGFNPVYSMVTDPTTRQTVVAVDYVGKDGVHAPGTETQYLTSQSVQQQLSEDDRAAATSNGTIYGTGQTMIDQKTNLGVKVNGVNTGGVDERQMLAARVATIQFEGIHDQAYPDGGGMTNGVGIHQNSPFYGGRGTISGNWTARDVQESFVQHSNWVTQQMPKQEASIGWNKDKPGQFQFMFQMSYQAGVNWYNSKPEYKQLAGAIRTGDANGALSALRSTPAYQAAGNERKAFYEASLRQGMSE